MMTPANNDLNRWSEWRAFPELGRWDTLVAPADPGCYQLRRKDSGQLVLYGMSQDVWRRMRSLLPKPFGTGTRNNTAKREYVLAHLANIEYRTLTCSTREQAQECEHQLQANRFSYIFPT